MGVWDGEGMQGQEGGVGEDRGGGGMKRGEVRGGGRGGEVSREGARVVGGSVGLGG